MCVAQAYENTRDAIQENVIGPWKENPIGGALGLATGLGPVATSLLIKRRKKDKKQKQPTTQTPQATQATGTSDNSMYINPTRSTR